MEFDESKSKPPSARTFLYNQVKEQSDLCDVTIKHGLWEKKFHWCVLVAIPFFENIRKQSYLERDTGKITMHVGTPVLLEEAILYVYGKKPKIKESNIAALLEIAEYLIIPALKAKCVLWIKRAKITDENCLEMITLASLFDFSLSSYEDYLKGHLPDLMQMEEMMDLTVDSVEYILEDADLLHIKASDKFSFLVRWTKSRQNRKSVFEQFLKYVDFADMERSFITNVVLNEPLVSELDASSSLIAQLESLETLSSCEILIFPEIYSNNKLPCYDMNRHRWCSLNIERNDIEYNSDINHIEFVRGKDCSEAYIYDRSYNKACVYIINFENNSVKRSDVKDVNAHETQKRQSNSEKKYVHDDELFVISSEKVCSDKSSAFKSRYENRWFSVSQLNVGKIKNDVTTTVPILSLKGTMSHVCANKTTIAMLQCDTNMLYLYNRKDCSLETIDLMDKLICLRTSDTIAEAGDNFVIHDNARFVSIAKQSGPSLLNNYLIIQHKWWPEKPKYSYLHEYSFCENRWYHKQNDRIKQPVFEFTTHEKLMVAVQDQGGIPEEIWEDLPDFDARCGGFEIPGTPLFQIKVSKERLSCALDCPHCELQRPAKIEIKEIRTNYRRDEYDTYGYAYDYDKSYGFNDDYGYDDYNSDRYNSSDSYYDSDRYY